MTSTGWVILVAVNTPVYFFLGWVFFRDWDNFFDALEYLLTPGEIKFVRQEHGLAFFSSLNFILWIGACAACVYLQGWLLEEHFDWLIKGW